MSGFWPDTKVVREGGDIVSCLTVSRNQTYWSVGPISDHQSLDLPHTVTCESTWLSRLLSTIAP
jgi:hypothetical protein